ncbi:MAG TPA: Holliday junction resolvase RuvX [Vicinamibacterales bacterium]|nr:Holliday junction resolvase RuvX [Vicinamibacterales bacterium]
MRVLGIDLGRRRIGLAVSDATRTLARPLRTIERGPSDRRAIADLVEIVRTLAEEPDGLTGIVVGLPRHLDGTPSDETAHVLEMVEALRRRVSIPVWTQDERLSSREAESRLALRERDWRRRKARLDAAAAAVILQDYLDSHAPAPSLEEHETS